MTQGALTVIVRVIPERLPDLSRYLNKIGDDVLGQNTLPFTRLLTVHFLRWVILPTGEDANGEKIPASLAFSTDYDGPLSDHLDELVAVLGPAMDIIYSWCENYPKLASTRPLQLKEFLIRYQVSYEAFYVGSPLRSNVQIDREDRLRQAAEQVLDLEFSLGKKCLVNSVEAANRVRSILSCNPQIEALKSCLRGAATGTSPAQYLLPIGIVLLVVASGISWFHLWGVVGYAVGLILILLACLLLFLRRKELTDKVAIHSISSSALKELLDREDYIVQNQITHLVNIKPGKLRLFLLKLVLRSINILARIWYNQGNLGGIPSIHFARWVIVDEGKRLLFFSNFDGSWESYLGDFIDQAHYGLTGIWSNTVGFPKTNWLIEDGATNEQGFKTWTRSHQIFTNLWYSAYRHLSVQNVNDNTAVRMGLLGTSQDEKSTREWLSHL